MTLLDVSWAGFGHEACRQALRRQRRQLDPVEKSARLLPASARQVDITITRYWTERLGLQRGQWTAS